MRMLIVGCLHGRLLAKVFNRMRKKDVDCVLISGDFGGGQFQIKLRDYEFNLVKKYGVIEDYWPAKVRLKAYATLDKWQKQSAKNVFSIFKKLSKLNKPVYFIHGNWDSISSSDIKKPTKRKFHEGTGDAYVNELQMKNVRFVHKKIIKIQDFYLIGFGGYRGTSGKEYLRDDIPDPKPSIEEVMEFSKSLKLKMESLFKRIKNKSKIIFLTHDPPYKTLDYLASRKKYYGEKITREMVEKYKPLICICSHFHEHQGIKKIGKTFVVNSGYGYDGQMALIDVTKSNVEIKLVN